MPKSRRSFLAATVGGAAAAAVGGCRLFGTVSRAAESGVQFTVDLRATGTPISPYIYGVADGDTAYMKGTGATVRRRGGNPTTRYNWELGNAWNTARDWYFQNTDYARNRPGEDKPGGHIDLVIADAKAAGAAMVVTIPTIGWVAKDRSQKTASTGVPEEGGVPHPSASSESIKGYDPTENRLRTSVRSVARKGRAFQYPPDLTDGTVYQDEWVAHLVERWGKAKDGGVRFYTMDNEPEIWDQTHTDVHPTRLSYEGLLGQFIEYASAVKDVDPTAEITGPGTWGWTNYFHSSLDRGDDNFRTAADRRAHGGEPFLSWFLKQARAHDQRVGRRTLDVFDVHYYPAGKGIYSDRTDPATCALRLRSVRSLWDASYADESWVKDRVRLIPRLREWVEGGYPGTKMGITEWNFGGESHMSGGLAIADALGVFGREGLYLGCYYRGPKPGTPGYEAFRLYRNYDGRGSKFGDLTLPVKGSVDPDAGSCYAARDSVSGDLTVVLINKSPDRPLPATVAFTGARDLKLEGAWRFGQDNGGQLQPDDRAQAAKDTVYATVPPYSAMLIRLSQAK